VFLVAATGVGAPIVGWFCLGWTGRGDFPPWPTFSTAVSAGLVLGLGLLRATPLIRVREATVGATVVAVLLLGWAYRRGADLGFAHTAVGFTGWSAAPAIRLAGLILSPLATSVGARLAWRGRVVEPLWLLIGPLSMAGGAIILGLMAILVEDAVNATLAGIVFLLAGLAGLLLVGAAQPTRRAGAFACLGQILLVGLIWVREYQDGRDTVYLPLDAIVAACVVPALVVVNFAGYALAHRTRRRITREMPIADGDVQ
jgi:hypothetical protein